MAPAKSTQLNIRSRFARERAAGLARATGMSVTQVVEEALRTYQPPGRASPAGRLVRAGRLLVMPAQGEAVSSEEADALIDEIRGDRR